MVVKREGMTSGDSSSLRLSQQLTHASEKSRRTTRYLLTDLPTNEVGKTAYLIVYFVVEGCIENRRVRLIMENGKR